MVWLEQLSWADRLRLNSRACFYRTDKPGVKFLGHWICTSSLEAPRQVKCDSSWGHTSSWTFFILLSLPICFICLFSCFTDSLRISLISLLFLCSQNLECNKCWVNYLLIYWLYLYFKLFLVWLLGVLFSSVFFSLILFGKNLYCAMEEGIYRVSGTSKVNPTVFCNWYWTLENQQ